MATRLTMIAIEDGTCCSHRLQQFCFSLRIWYFCLFFTAVESVIYVSRSCGRPACLLPLLLHQCVYLLKPRQSLTGSPAPDPALSPNCLPYVLCILSYGLKNEN